MKYIRLKSEELAELAIFTDTTIVEGTLKSAKFQFNGFEYHIQSGYDCLLVSREDYEINTTWEVYQTLLGKPNVTAIFNTKEDAQDFIDKLNYDGLVIVERIKKYPCGNSNKEGAKISKGILNDCPF